MYAGKIAETGARRDIFYRPQHPYTKGLLHSVPRLDLEDADLVPIDGHRRICFLRLKDVRLRRAVPAQWKCAAKSILPLQKSRWVIECAAGFRMKGQKGSADNIIIKSIFKWGDLMKRLTSVLASAFAVILLFGCTANEQAGQETKKKAKETAENRF